LTHRTLRRRHKLTGKAPPKGIWEYAHFKNVSSDGCSTKQDVDYRSEMLRHAAKGHENGWLAEPKAWVSW
jgi:hypothetical protein